MLQAAFSSVNSVRPCLTLNSRLPVKVYFFGVKGRVASCILFRNRELGIGFLEDGKIFRSVTTQPRARKGRRPSKPVMGVAAFMASAAFRLRSRLRPVPTALTLFARLSRQAGNFGFALSLTGICFCRLGRVKAVRLLLLQAALTSVNRVLHLSTRKRSLLVVSYFLGIKPFVKSVTLLTKGIKLLILSFGSGKTFLMVTTQPRMRSGRLPPSAADKKSAAALALEGVTVRSRSGQAMAIRLSFDRLFRFRSLFAFTIVCFCKLGMVKPARLLLLQAAFSSANNVIPRVTGRARLPASSLVGSPILVNTIILFKKAFVFILLWDGQTF